MSRYMRILLYRPFRLFPLYNAIERKLSFVFITQLVPIRRSSCCYQSVSFTNCSWTSLSPASHKTTTAMEQLGTQPMDDLRDCVNFPPTPSELFQKTYCTPSSVVGWPASGGSIGGFSPNSCPPPPEDGGFGTGLVVYNRDGVRKTFR